MDVSLFHGLLTNLADICPWQFEIWEGRHPIFATTPLNGGPPQSAREALASAIMGGETCKKVRRGTNTFLAGAPLRNKEEIIGALLAWNSHSRTSLPAVNAATIEAFLGRLTEVIEDGWTVRMEAEKTSEELGQSYEDLYLYARISGWVKSMHFSTDMLNNLIGQVLDTMRVDMVFVHFAGRLEGREIVHTEEFTSRVSDKQDLIDRLIEAIPEQATSLIEHYFVVNDSRQIPSYGKLHTEPFRALMVKIQNNENFYGWFGLVSFNMKEIFRRSELRLIASMAEQVAAVITNTELYRDLEKFVINMVTSLVQAIEAKDVYTRGHSERVSRYSMLMAERLNLDEHQKTHLRWASILHDVGKIGIPEAVLNKPGPLTDEEYNLIKSHPAKGYAILEPLEPLAGSLPGILHHHERYDGRGYPDGLQGEQIPLFARIIAVPDTYDAINSDRAYRLGRLPRETMPIVKSLAGTQLDARMVEILLEVITELEGCSKEKGGTG